MNNVERKLGTLENKKIGIYCRVSTDEQARHGESVADQQQALLRWARENNHIVIDTYPDEGYSAHKSFKSRPALMRLLSDIEKGKIELVVFTKFDRWTRKASDYYKLQDILDKYGVAWKAILEDYDTMTSDGRFKVGIMLSVNQHEAERTSDRIKFTFAEKRKRGEIVSGNMPRGYKLKGKKPVKDEAVQDAVTAFWQTYLQGRSLSQAQKAAAALGCPINGSSASFMLRNAMNYAGCIQGVACEPYITEEQAQLVLNTRKSKPKPSDTVYLFSGLLKCGDCGKNYGGHTNYYTHADGAKVKQIFYCCTHRYRTEPKTCHNPTAYNENTIEEHLLANIASVLDDYAVKASERQNTRQSSPDADKRSRERRKLQQRGQRAWDAYLDGLIDKDKLKSEQDKIAARLAELEEPAPQKEKTPEEIKANLPSGWREMYSSLSQEGKREFWFRIIDHITIGIDRSITVFPRV